MKKNNLSSSIYHLTSNKAFTLVEILIVVAIIIILTTIGLVALNPKKQIEKTWDSKRKAEINSLKKTLEDWYNDHNRYPIDTEICYDSFSSDNTCHLCGSHINSPNFSPYLSRLPCDPQSPTKEYLYQVDNINSPTWFRIYTKLSSTQDPDIAAVGCSAGCGPPASSYVYNYGVSSPNIDLESNPGLPACSDDLWCSSPLYICNHCGSLSNCITSCGNPYTLYLQSPHLDCSIPCQP